MDSSTKNSMNIRKDVILVPKRGRLLARLGVSIAVFFVSFLILFILALYLIFIRTRASVELHPQLRSQAVAIQVGEVMNSITEDGAHVARLSAREFYPASASLIHEEINNSPMFAALYFVDSDGHVLWSMFRSGVATSSPIFTPDTSEVRTLDAPWKDVSGATYMYAHYPVFSQSGKIEGYLISQIDLTVLLSAFTSESEVGVWLVDNKGQVFLSSNTVEPTPDEGSGVVAQYLSGLHDVVEYKHANGAVYYEAWSPVLGFHWAVVAFEPYGRVYDMMRGVLYIGLSSLVLMISLALYQKFIFDKYLFKPLLSISEGAEHMSRGDLSVWISPKVDNELGGLASALNLLAFKLRWLKQGQEERIAQALSQAKLDAGEAERLNTFMVHRELRMTELKEELRKCQYEAMRKEEGGVEEINKE